MARIIAMAIQKGGSGKTTTTYNLASVLAEQHQRRVLAVDFDPQASLTHFCNIPRSTAAFDAISRRAWQPVRPAEHAFDLLASGIDLAGAELTHTRYPNWGDLLHDALQTVAEQYDYILVDAPPSLGLLTVNAVYAADGLIIPVQTEEEAARGMGLLFETLAGVMPANRVPPLIAVVPTRFDGRSNYHKEILAGLRQTYGALVTTPIKLSVRLPESTTMHLPISRYEKDMATPYYELAQMVEEWSNG